MSAGGTILVVDDNDVDRERIRRFLGSRFTTREAATAAAALAACDEHELECVLLDYRLPDRDGIDLIEELVGRSLPVIMLTGQGDEHVAVEAMKRGAGDYLVKSLVDAASLRRAVEHAIGTARMRRRIEAQQAELEARLEELAHRGAELEAANRALSEREAKLRIILKQLPAVVWTVGEDLLYTSMSGLSRVSAFTDDEVLGRPVGYFLGDVQERELHVRAHRSALAGESVPFEISVCERAFEGAVEPFRDDAGRILGAIGAAMDVTSTRLLQHQLQRSQKMEALGKLAGGIAHDFNNILTAIVSFAGFARENLTESSPARDDIGQVIEAANRGTALVRQLLAFSRQRPVEQRVVDVNAALTALVPMLRRLLGEDIELRLETDPELWRARIDPGGLEQIVINMVVNARDAMPRGGRLSISTERLVLHESLATRTRAELSPGSYVVINFADEGEGIPPEVQERIFEPFFTTKAAGSGTGLGLATCWGIAQQAGGSISVYSEEGRGTIFRVYLPRHYGASEDRVTIPVGLRDTLYGSELVLVVEDDAQVRALTTRALRVHGYAVLEAADAEGALVHANEHGDAIRLVLADVVMPQANGPELVAILRDRLPNARVLFMSGYAGMAIRQRGLVDEGAFVLQKPFTPEALLRKVRQVLDEA